PLRLFKRDGGCFDEPGERAISESRQRVLFGHQRRRVHQRGRQDHRSRSVSADADHHVRPDPLYQGADVEKTLRQHQQRLDAVDKADALERGHVDQFQIESLARNDLRLEASRRAYEENLRIRVTPLELLRDGDAGVDVSAGAAAGDDDGERKRRRDGGTERRRGRRVRLSRILMKPFLFNTTHSYLSVSQPLRSLRSLRLYFSFSTPCS